MAELNLQTGPPPMPSVDETVQRWLVPTLSKVPDEDLAQFLMFVGGRFGGDYYVALTRTYDLKAGEWYAQMVKSFTDNIPPAELLPGAPDRNALVTDARRALRDVATPAAAADAMVKLQQADRLDPRDAEIQMLLGEAAMKTAPPMPLTPGVLRVVIVTPNYDIADRHLATALQLQPGLADAYMLQGRLRFLQGKDDDALALYARAQKLEPDHPSLDLYRGDVAYAQNQLMQAINFYKASIAKPERLAFTHVSALRNLLMALQKSTQLPEYQRIADAYLAKNPEAWNFRLDYADYLLSIDTPADKILGVIEPVPDSWFPARKTPALSAALVRKAVERVDKRTSEPTDESMGLIRRTRSLNPEVGPMAEAMCRGDITTRLVRRTLETTPNAKSLATALVLCGLRWRRDDIVRAMATRADIARLSMPQTDLGGDTPLCYSVLTKNLVGFIQLAEARVSPARKCSDGNTVAERLLQMSYGRDPNIVQMQILMKRFYKKE